MKLTKKIAAVVVALSVGCAAFALDGREVMQNAHDVPDPKFTRAEVRMILIEKNGATETRVIQEWGKSEIDSASGESLATLVMQFDSPAGVKGTRFSQKENGPGKDDTKFIFMPEVGTVRPIAASQGTQSFMGSDATYDDMSTREVDEDTHELLAETEEKNGYTCAKVKSTPKDAKSSQYAYRINWVDKETWVPVYVEMYSKKTGKVCKTLEVKKLKVIKGYPTPLETEMTDCETGHRTQLLMNEQRLIFDDQSKVPPAVFSKAFLQNGKLSK